MQIRHEVSRKETAQMNTEELRENFLIETLFVPNRIEWVYSHYDRVLTGGAMPVGKPVTLETYEALKADFFLQRRELGIINVGGKGVITADGESFDLDKLGCLYLGKGTQTVTLSSQSVESPARFFLLSAPAHHTYPNRAFTKEEASPVNLGALETSNHRTIYKYIHEGGIQSCQLVMGLTVLQTGSVWNTMPSHTHDRRMEVYCYFDVPENQGVLHLMGEPTQTRHLWVANHQAVISPPWSVHSGCGTSRYSFIWGMAGENKDFTDMDLMAIPSLR
ncbi:MAG: 5-dehydro-4-deoxy-D-glucuronate isomerase [Spirosomataceae bacterium]